MKLNRFLTRALGGLALLPLSLPAQEALRSAVQTDLTLQNRPLAPVRGPDTMHWGPVQLSLGASLSAEYNDNIQTGNSNNRMDDVIIRPQIDVGFIWPITQTSALTFGMGIGYDTYIEHNEYNALILLPNSALVYAVTIKDLTLSVFEQVDYSEDVVSEAQLSQIARYPRLNNTAGLRAAWNLEKVQLIGGYSHYNFVAYDDDYDYLTRASEQFLARAGYLFAPATTAGLETSISLTAYDQSTRSDFNSFSFGPYVQWAVTEGLTLTARGGYVIYDTDQSAPGSPEDLDSYYVQLAGTHRLTDYINHTLSAVRSVDVGIDSAYLERFAFLYGIRWQMTTAFDVGLGVEYEFGRESGDAVNPEEYDRYGFNVGAGYQWTDHLRSSLSYRYYDRVSNDATQDYNNNIVSLTVGYRF